jgi:hypothetical protein
LGFYPLSLFQSLSVLMDLCKITRKTGEVHVYI